jgi:phage shock protein A
MIVQKTDFQRAFWWLEHQRIFFFAAFIIGTFTILSLKILGVHGIYASAAAVFIMLLYAVLGSRQRLQIRLDVLGDNLYYLGFLFTLVSLAYSLHQLGTGRADINHILENFGLAIATTLSGLALRVFFNQPKADIHEYENAIRFSLTEATGNFIGEISKMSRDVSNLSTILNQVVEETNETHKEAVIKINQLIEDQRNSLKESFEINQNNISKLTSNFIDSQNKFNDDLKLNSIDLAKSIENIISNISYSSEKFNEEFLNITKSAHDLRSSISQLDTSLEQWDLHSKDLINNSATVNSNAEKSINSVINASTQLETHIENFPSKINNLITSLNKSIENISQSINNKDEILSRDITSLSINIITLNDSIKDFSKNASASVSNQLPSNN